MASSVLMVLIAANVMSTIAGVKEAKLQGSTSGFWRQYCYHHNQLDRGGEVGGNVKRFGNLHGVHYSVAALGLNKCVLKKVPSRVL